MNTKSISLGLVAVGVVALAASASLAQPVGTSKLVPPVQTQAATRPNCVGESALSATVDKSTDIKLLASKPVNVTSWTTELTLTGSVVNVDGSPGRCQSPSVTIVTDDADARASLQTCALMGTSMPAGRKLNVVVRALTQMGTSGRVARPALIECRLE